MLWVADDYNVFIGNMAINNGHLGMEIFGDNHLLLNNILVNNRLGGISNGLNANCVMVSNIINDNPRNGCFMRELINLFFGENKVEANRLEGIAFLEDSSFGIFRDNIIRHNINTSITLDPSTQSNLLVSNKFRCNIPANIVDSGADNNFIGNIDEPCKPGELPFEDCEVCFKDFMERRITGGYHYQNQKRD